MRSMSLAFLTAAVLGGSILAGVPAQAQRLDVGPGGVGVDLRTPGQRARDRELREMEREDRRDRRRAMRDRYDGCREVTVTERNRYGERVTRTRRECR